MSSLDNLVWQARSRQKDKAREYFVAAQRNLWETFKHVVSSEVAQAVGVFEDLSMPNSARLAFFWHNQRWTIVQGAAGTLLVLNPNMRSMCVRDTDEFLLWLAKWQEEQH